MYKLLVNMKYFNIIKLETVLESEYLLKVIQNMSTTNYKITPPTELATSSRSVTLYLSSASVALSTSVGSCWSSSLNRLGVPIRSSIP